METKLYRVVRDAREFELKYRLDYAYLAPTPPGETGEWIAFNYGDDRGWVMCRRVPGIWHDTFDGAAAECIESHLRYHLEVRAQILALRPE